MEVTGRWRNNVIEPEIPAFYAIYHKKPSKIKKLIHLRREKEDKADGYVDSVNVSIHNKLLNTKLFYCYRIEGF